MPHRCVKCSAFYPDSANEIIKGCACGSQAFFYIKLTKPEEGECHLPEERTNGQASFSFETVSMDGDGKYELDLVRIFGSQDIIYREDEGKYSIDLEQSFKKSLRN